jgi:hypothetical protein
LNLTLRGPFPDRCKQEGRGLPGSRFAFLLSCDVSSCFGGSLSGASALTSLLRAPLPLSG